MRKNGFTLTELLAVVVILGILAAVGGASVIKIKNDANQKEAEQIVEMLKDLGPAIYTYEYTSGIKSMKDYCKKTWDGSYKDGSCVLDLNNYIEKRKADECALAKGNYNSGVCKNKEDKTEITLNHESLLNYVAAAKNYCFNSYKKENGYITEEAFAETSSWNNDNYICNIPVDTNKHEKYFYHKYKTEPIYLSFETLYKANYLNNATTDGIKNPAGGDACTGYLSVSKTDSGPEFQVCLKCPGIQGYENNDCKIDYGYNYPLLTK